jgi:DNA-binding NtrC family response regulator
MEGQWRVVVASSDLEHRQRIVEMLNGQGIEPFCGSTIAQCRELLAKDDVGLVFCDRDLTDGSYRDLLAVAACKSTRGRVRVVLMSSSII